MTWTKFLAALVAGGWSADITPDGPDVDCRAEANDTVIETRWTGVGRKFARATINGLDAGYAELAAALK